MDLQKKTKTIPKPKTQKKNNMEIEIEGGVSPLKKRRGRKGRKSQKRDVKGKLAGKAGIRNTATKRGRRGFSKAGRKGVNVHGYGALTRFKHNPKNVDKGPLSKATTPKTGGGGGNYTAPPVTAGGGNITIDNSIHDAFNTSAIQNNDFGPVLTNETNTDARPDAKLNQESKQVQNNKTRPLEGYDEFWVKRIENEESWSPGMRRYIKKHGGDLKKARKEWEYVSRKNESKRNANRQKNVSNQDQDLDQSTNVESEQKSKINFAPVQNVKGSKYDGNNPNIPSSFKYKSSSPNKMKSHAWDMVRHMQKLRGGTAKNK